MSPSEMAKSQTGTKGTIGNIENTEKHKGKKIYCNFWLGLKLCVGL
jgi:hypothetical protein